jgi:hypothetical protein
LYKSKYGSGFILPALSYVAPSGNLLTSGGSNNTLYPNLYWYQSSVNSVNPAVFGFQQGTTISNFDTDSGAENFFNAICGVVETLGGGIQWANGNMSYP